MWSSRSRFKNLLPAADADAACSGELLYGGTLQVNQPSLLQPALAGRGNLVGEYKNTASFVMSVYGNWSF